MLYEVITLDFAASLRSIWAFLAAANRYVDRAAPWSLMKADKPDEAKAALYAAAESLRLAALLVSSTLLFYLGAAFAYFVVFPLVYGSARRDH